MNDSSDLSNSISRAVYILQQTRMSERKWEHTRKEFVSQRLRSNDQTMICLLSLTWFTIFPTADMIMWLASYHLLPSLFSSPQICECQAWLCHLDRSKWSWDKQKWVNNKAIQKNNHFEHNKETKSIILTVAITENRRCSPSFQYLLKITVTSYCCSKELIVWSFFCSILYYLVEPIFAPPFCCTRDLVANSHVKEYNRKTHITFKKD